MQKQGLIVLACILVLGVAGASQAGYTILSSSYWAQGIIGQQVIYEFTSPAGPVGSGYSAASGNNNFHSSAGPFNCSAEVYFPETPEPAVDDQYFKAAASCTVTFRPHGDELEIFTQGAIWEDFYEPDFTGGWMYLTDTTNGDTVFSFGASEIFGGGLFSVRPDHIYQLYMYYETSGVLPVLFNGGFIEAELIVAMPEPASAILLIAGGLILPRKKK